MISNLNENKMEYSIWFSRTEGAYFILSEILGNCNFPRIEVDDKLVEKIMRR